MRLPVVIALGLLALPDAAQQPRDFQLTTSTELVLVPVVVTDKSGAHLRSLKKDAFVILQDGREQTVSVFEEVSTTTARPAAPPATAQRTFTNRIADETPRRLTIIAIDLINTPPLHQIEARDALLKYLADVLDTGELVSVVALKRGEVRIVQDFTSDPQRLIAALRKGPRAPHTAVERPTGEIKPHEETKDAAERRELEIIFEQQENDRALRQAMAITATLDDLRQIAHAYAGVSGRKALLWLTGGFPFNVSDPLGEASAPINSPQFDENASIRQLFSAGRASLGDVWPLYVQTWRELGHAQIAIYPIDTRGLIAGSTPPASIRRATRTFNREASNETIDTQESMRAFAEMTGGRAYYNSNDLVRGVRESAADSGHYYLLGFYVDKKSKPGWHDLRVKVHAEGAQVRSRTGFFLAAPEDNTPKQIERDLRAAMDSPLDYTGLPLQVEWGAPVRANGRTKIPFSVSIPPNTIVIDEADGNHFLLDVVAQPRLSNGKPTKTPFSERLEARLKPESVQKLRTEPLVYGGTLELPAGEYSVRFVVRDGISQRIGSVHAPLTVAP